MSMDGLDDATIREILTNTRRVAVVGASSKPYRPSNGVLAFLVRRGYDVTPVNPGCAGQQIHGRTAVASLAEAAPLDMVDVFRNSAYVAPVVDEAIRLGAKTVWMQLGVIDQQAADKARRAGITVVMDRCPAIEAPRLGLLAHH
ncbi:MAG: CoA-binding protein [Acetobacteraceae bacterium]|nr:CoA-binding protein [Acetobacteraceae bacterium]MBV8523448.1 CoA-binding protein [Acetobacteraceae bacterium]MBV8589670.1 CoA-binding protein [Acetobacteraceae bacterium]